MILDNKIETAPRQKDFTASPQSASCRLERHTNRLVNGTWVSNIEKIGIEGYALPTPPVRDLDLIKSPSDTRSQQIVVVTATMLMKTRRFICKRGEINFESPQLPRRNPKIIKNH